ncbi:protein-L-isoaspartate O-methyltransferase [Streptomyces sp. NPDC018000]|uniref:protein-L-isoaspartate O-methyltransferase n=1 Tax=Streptomyces sp. NPDC018000 TaxID=3365028 RepID=UPI0037AA3A82
MTEAAYRPEDLVRAVRAAGISDERLLQAVRTTPRAAFVPAGHQAHAYHDVPISIGHGQVTTQPSLSAVMIEGLDLSVDEHVLEIGAGLGFQTALLARLATDVVSIERWPDIAHQAQLNLARQGIRNVPTVGDTWTGQGPVGHTTARCHRVLVETEGPFPGGGGWEPPPPSYLPQA